MGKGWAGMCRGVIGWRVRAGVGWACEAWAFVTWACEAWAFVTWAGVSWVGVA